MFLTSPFIDQAITLTTEFLAYLRMLRQVLFHRPRCLAL
jgi:hypothetical protein